MNNTHLPKRVGRVADLKPGGVGYSPIQALDFNVDRGKIVGVWGGAAVYDAPLPSSMRIERLANGSVSVTLGKEDLANFRMDRDKQVALEWFMPGDSAGRAMSHPVFPDHGLLDALGKLLVRGTQRFPITGLGKAGLGE